MRQIFTAMPYVPPKEPEPIVAWLREHATKRRISRGEVLKYGGEANRLFYLENGLCAYFIAGELTGRASILSLLPPGRTMGDMTASIGAQCNVLTQALSDSLVWVIPPTLFREAIFANPTLAQLKFHHAVLKEESTLEGMVANFTRPATERLKILFKALLLDASHPLADQPWQKIPYRLTDEVLGQVVNLARPNVSAILSHWRQEGLMKKVGNERWVHEALFQDIFDWLERPDRPKPDWTPKLG